MPSSKKCSEIGKVKNTVTKKCRRKCVPGKEVIGPKGNCVKRGKSPCKSPRKVKSPKKYASTSPQKRAQAGGIRKIRGGRTRPKQVFTTKFQNIELGDLEWMTDAISDGIERFGTAREKKILNDINDSLKKNDSRGGSEAMSKLNHFDMTDTDRITAGTAVRELHKLPNLVTISMTGTGVRKIPENFSQLKNLRKLYVDEETVVPNLPGVEIIKS